MGVVQNQNPLLLMDAMAGNGCVLPTEVAAALDTSLMLKRTELGAVEFNFWGKISTTNGKDYYIAQAFNGATVVGDKYVPAATNNYYYSQDGVNWLDLEAASEAQMEKAGKLDVWLAGDPANTFTVYEPQPLPEPEPMPEVPEGEEPPAPEPVEPLPDLEFPVSELEYLYVIIRAIDTTCFAFPSKTVVPNAKGELVYNPEFPGVKYPDKLSSYMAMGGTLDQDIPGKWGLVYDSFKQLAIIRNLQFPGAFSYYSGATNSVGRCYFGSGMKNKDLAFCV